ncbi:ABC transporter domain-containing protein [Ditylenchus destructor]|nr:ABC transporter domain-containing protein [Ditylenchus destructor]
MTVGASGSGKSTIGHLLLRLYDPSQGRILVDDTDLREIDPSEWPNPESVTEEQIVEAAVQSNWYVVNVFRIISGKLLFSYEFIQTFPDKFDTMVGESGASMLSGGQKQRIAIARALILKPRVLILDEATSALDATSEYLVRKALQNLLENNRQTVLIIAHRLSTIKHANQIVVLDKGAVAEVGNFDELMRLQGIFNQLVEKQAIGWRDDQF